RIFAQHEYSSPAQIEELLHRYAPQTQQAANTQELIRLIGEHTHRVTLDWAQGNALSGLPLDMISLIPTPEEVDAGQGAPVGTGIQMAGRALYSLGRVFSSTLRGIFRKPKTKASVKSHNPAKVMQQLGTGQKLSANARKQMEGAFGSNFSQVEVHTDQTAAQLATDMNARAFTVGNHVAFGSGEYRPGTLVGDALLAHELAHVEQQKGASLQAQTKLEMGGAAYNTLEQEADEAANQVIVHNYIHKKTNPKQQTQSKRGLSLQRCSSDLDYDELSPQEQKDLREKILKETSVEYTPNPKSENVYGGITMSISLNAPQYFDVGYTKYPYVQSLTYEFPDGYSMHRQVNPVSNQFMTIGEGLHKIKGTIRLLPDMPPAIFEKRINVISLRSLSDPKAQEDINASQRGEALFSEMLALQNLTGELRVKALNVGLPPTLLDTWFAANAKVIVIESLMSKNQTIDPRTLSEMVDKVAAFYQEFRKVVAQQDYEAEEEVYMEEGQYEKVKVTKNPFLSPGALSAKLSILQHERVGTQVKISDFLWTTKTLDQYIETLFEKNNDKESGKTLRAAVSIENALREIYAKHGNVQSVKAIFYPLEQSQLEGGLKPGDTIPKDYRAKKYDLRFYIYKTVSDSTITWHLIDATNPDKVLETKENGGTATNPPDTLFTELDNASRFPKGILHWQVPGQARRSHDIVHPLTFTQFLTYLGIGLAVLGITLATAGAGTAATIFFVAGGIVGAAGAISDIKEKSDLGVLTAKDVFLDSITIATSLLSAGTAAAGRVIATGVGATGNFAKLAVGLDKIYKPLTGLTLAADAISLAVFTVDFAHQVNMVIESNELTRDTKKEAMTRLVFQGLLTGGLSLLAVKGSMADFRKGRSLYLDLSPTGPQARLVISDAGLLGHTLIGSKKTDLEAIFNQLNAPGNQRQLFQIKAEISAAIESGVIKQADIAKFIDEIKAAGGDISKVEKLLLDFRTRNFATIKADFEAFSGKAKGRGLTDSQAAISYEVARSTPTESPVQNIDKSKPLDRQVDQLYDQAKVADGELKSITKNITAETGGEPGFRPEKINGGLKGRERALEKINKDYGGDASQLIDIAGAQIVFTKIDELYKALKKISQKATIVKFKDKIVSPYDSGYGDIKISLRMSNGHVVELKLLMKNIEEISSREHALYDKIRSGIKLTPVEQQQADSFAGEYKEAWKKILEQNKKK
ncbi:MAG: DUF4157 domain-containing protein, partial [Microscillaceae bacterium]|nr:DUF4157 domain-containing protein [Microscillaceae bacterium]